MDTCKHVAQVQLLTQRSAAALRNHSTAGSLSAKMVADDTMAACKAECGDASPYRDVELHPIPREAAVAVLEPSGYGDILMQEFADMTRAAGRFLRRLRRRDKEN